MARVSSTEGIEAVKAEEEALKLLDDTINGSKQLPKLAQDLRKDTQSQVEYLAKASCRALAERLCATVPREIRDEVYMDIISNPNDIASVGEEPCLPAWAGRLMVPSALIPPGLALYSETETFIYKPHCWDANFVGGKFLKEIMKAWYRNVLFDFGLSHNLVPKFLASVVPRFNINPGQVFTKIQLRVFEDDLTTKNGEGPANEYHNERGESFYKSLECLTKVEHRISVRVKIDKNIIWTWRPRVANTDGFVDKLHRLHNTLCLVEDVGHKVEVFLARHNATSLQNIRSFPQAWAQ